MPSDSAEIDTPERVFGRGLNRDLPACRWSEADFDPSRCRGRSLWRLNWQSHQLPRGGKIHGWFYVCTMHSESAKRLLEFMGMRVKLIPPEEA